MIIGSNGNSAVIRIKNNTAACPFRFKRNAEGPPVICHTGNFGRNTDYGRFYCLNDFLCRIYLPAGGFLDPCRGAADCISACHQMIHHRIACANAAAAGNPNNQTANDKFCPALFLFRSFFHLFFIMIFSDRWLWNGFFFGNFFLHRCLSTFRRRFFLQPILFFRNFFRRQRLSCFRKDFLHFFFDFFVFILFCSIIISSVLFSGSHIFKIQHIHSS